MAKRISDNSSSKNVFDEPIPIYSDALRKSGFHGNITFIPRTTDTKTNKRKSRKRKIIWLNPQYCLSAKTNAGRLFLKQIKNTFLSKKGNSLKVISSTKR